jgi:adenylate kinase family enzyme
MDPQAFRKLQEGLAARPAWIIDGGYTGDLDTRLSRADAVVFLDLPRSVCLWQLVKRHNRRRPDYPDGVREGVGRSGQRSDEAPGLWWASSGRG